MLATTIVSTPTIVPREALSQIVSRRATCQGIQYTVADSLGSHIVTVNNGCIGCSWGLDRFFLECSHKRIVATQELAYAKEAASRAVFAELFGIY